jgi:cell division initiation protein
MQENARRQAEVIVAEEETKAEKLLQQAQNRLAQLQESIAGLKRQRVQVEAEITFVIENHRRLLEADRESTRELDALDEKLKVLRPSQ